ncbi:hypothetical protein [Halalkalibacter okhensis]|uniref:Uncharacterized protein n=1 Tax=Halalkalibacter okhensis TaxID=333138 RepID=A0A0B0IM17_9BACI|nr:hypothetical protein [Halalkalibacter okhensis]KHF40716.1 hypothetical protein LQ50_07955 [Halalkalibacter okhensis]
MKKYKVNIYIESIEPQYYEIRGGLTGLDNAQMLVGFDVHYSARNEDIKVNGVVKIKAHEKLDMGYESLQRRVNNELSKLVSGELKSE